MNSSYVAIGTNLPKLFKLIRQNSFSIHPKYFFRFFLLFQSGLWSSVFSIIEKIKHHKKINNTPLPSKPVFIIGHWRTGSTFLHQIMSLDDAFITPSVFHVTVPECFISIEKYYKPVMKKMMGNKRPMDNVKFGPDAPQEDEFALFRMTQNSPLQKLIFPKKNKYFISDIDNLLPYKSKISHWENALTYFYKKLYYVSGKQLLIKNPFHSFRIGLLNKLFPDALFIHIYRNPSDVIPSTIRMWDIIARQNCLNTKWEKPTTEDASKFLKNTLSTIEKDLKKISTERYIEVDYGIFEKDPLNEIKKIYYHFGLTYSQEFENDIIKFLDEEKNYIKNKHELSVEDKNTIDKYFSTPSY